MNIFDCEALKELAEKDTTQILRTITQELIKQKIDNPNTFLKETNDDALDCFKKGGINKKEMQTILNSSEEVRQEINKK